MGYDRQTILKYSEGWFVVNDDLGAPQPILGVSNMKGRDPFLLGEIPEIFRKGDVVIYNNPKSYALPGRYIFNGIHRVVSEEQSTKWACSCSATTKRIVIEGTLV